MNHLLKKPHLLYLLTIIALGAFLRFYNLNWDQGHYLHPDERLYVNASNIKLPQSFEEFLSSDSPLNPNMFYYGSFPLFLYKAVYTIFTPTESFLVTSRFISSLFSILTILVVYFIGKILFSNKVGLVAAFIFAFSVGSIQHAHFNTTESILTFFLSLITLFSVYLLKQKTYIFAIFLGILTGAAYATKIIGLTFLFIPIISFILIFFKKRKILKLIISIITFIILSIITGFLLAPYQVIDYEQFSREQAYMQGVTYGKDKPPFIIIYEGTLPYVYQITKILPFTFGFISFPLALIGLFFLLKDFINNKESKHLYIFILIYPLLYFLWVGEWYAKFSRYYMPLFPFLSIWTAYILGRFKKTILILVLCLISINGIIFLKIYQKPNTRIQASEWIYHNVPNKSILLGEHWDDNLPLPIANWYKQYNMMQLSVYDQDSYAKISQLSENLGKGDYFIISSRRVYYSILKNEKVYPYTSRFYRLLFAGQLGYRQVATFTNYPFFFSDDVADESFQSYDHPPVYIFKNEKKLPPDQISNMLL